MLGLGPADSPVAGRSGRSRVDFRDVFFFFRSSEGFQKVCCQGLLGLSVALLWEGLEAVVRKELGLEVVPSSPALQTPAPRS